MHCFPEDILHLPLIPEHIHNRARLIFVIEDKIPLRPTLNVRRFIFLERNLRNNLRRNLGAVDGTFRKEAEKWPKAGARLSGEFDGSRDCRLFKEVRISSYATGIKGEYFNRDTLGLDAGKKC
jgi:hypothetical protein